jgi:hypothetical protein
MGAGAHTSSLTVQTALAELDRLPLEDQDAVLTQMDIIHQRRSRGRGN